jgi:hypothetical protein
MNAEQLNHLEKSINNLRTELRKLTSGDDLAALIPVIHRPGFTTPAEATLVAGIVNAMTVHAQALLQLQGALVKGANMVGAK